MGKKHVEISKDILNHIGGKDNVASALYFYRRLRINIKDKSLVDTEALKSSDILGTQFMDNQLQIIIGDSVSDIYQAFVQVYDIENQAMIEDNIDQKEKEKFSFNQLFG